MTENGDPEGDRGGDTTYAAFPVGDPRNDDVRGADPCWDLGVLGGDPVLIVAAIIIT